MKKILYFVRYPLYEKFHIQKKIDGQLDAFHNLGLDVYYIAFDKEYFYLINGDNKTVIGKTHFFVPNYFHTLVYDDYYKLAKRIIQEEGIDYVYYRKCPSWPSTVRFAQQMKKQNIAFFYEDPTYLANSEEKSLSYLRDIYKKISHGWKSELLSVVSLYVLIGDPAPEFFQGKPATNVYNGIIVDVLPVREPVSSKSEIHILALSSMCVWHGYDRLINSLAAYTGKEKVIIHFVGSDDGKCLNEWQNLVKEKGLEHNVIFHGALFGEELDKLFNLCDIGVNSMGMYRKGTNVSSELKAKEYVSRGLPFVSSVSDILIDKLDNDLFLRIDNDDSIPEMEEIVNFAKRTRQDASVVSRLREHAETHFSWEEQYRKFFEYYEGIKRR